VAPAKRTEQVIAGQIDSTQSVVDQKILGIKAEFAVVLALILLMATGVIVALSQTITRPLERLSDAAGRLERGDMDDPAIERLRSAEGNDEVASLMRVFARMAEQVRTREQELRKEVQDLHIEIDRAKAAKEVAEITESDYFQDLQAKARALRASRAPSPASPEVDPTG
jgi:nitrate/nitrite-specific signal transduction histidine kinase